MQRSASSGAVETVVAAPDTVVQARGVSTYRWGATRGGMSAGQVARGLARLRAAVQGFVAGRWLDSRLARALLFTRTMVVALVQVRLHTAVVVGAGPPAAALWQRLRRGFPWTVAAVLRGRSLVWLGRVPTPAIATGTMERVLSPTRRRLGWPRIDLDVREVAAPRVGAIAREVHGRPSSTEALPGWSTARDLLGGVVDPWVHPEVHRRLTWGDGGTWEPVSLGAIGIPRGPWLEPSRAALRAPWLHPTAPTVAGLVRGVRARVSGAAVGPVPRSWVEAALRCALDPRLRGFPQPPATARPSAEPEPLRRTAASGRRGRR